ncbi:hypothetical protein FQA39_LY00461 [Lamprigera yunnana]|nr:hypothetical protein FQA39_LY00461 [Lamprigera yunnana]
MENDEVFVKWTEPPYKTTCNISYILDMYDDDDVNVYSINTTNTTHKIDFEFIGCMIYRIMVLPVAEEVEGSQNELLIVFSKETNAPKCNVTEERKTTATIYCSFDTYKENMCEIEETLLTCHDLPNVVTATDFTPTNITSTITIDDNESRDPIRIDLSNLTAFTNYTCWTTVKTKNDLWSPHSEIVMFQTKQDGTLVLCVVINTNVLLTVPGPPLLRNSSSTNTSLSISWDAPLHVPGVITKYNITIVQTRPMYYIPEDCGPSEKQLYGDEVDSNTTEYIANNVLPGHEYEVYVKARTIDYGPPSDTKYFQTNGGIPQEPRATGFNVRNLGNPDHNVVDISWKYPCSAYGIIKFFTVDIIGYPKVDLHIRMKNETNILNVTGRTDYKYTIKNLEPAFNYTILLKSVTEDNLESNTTILRFETPNSHPTRPIIKAVYNVTNTSFTIEWDEPYRKNGKLEAYYIYIFTNSSNHIILNDCNRPDNLNNYETVAANQTEFTFKHAQPNYNYTIMIHACADGNNGTTDVCYVRTLDSVPEKVRNLDLRFINIHQEYYNGHITVNFKPPCNLNGNFEKISIFLNGTRTNKKHSYHIQTIESILPEYNFLMDIQPQYYYILIVQVKTENYAQNTTKYFISPSGVPLLANYYLQRPIPLNSRQAKFNLSKKIFDDTYGDIIYYDIIIGQFSHEEDSKFGYWDGTEETWPIIVGDLNKEWLQPHALTPRFWNPFKDTNATEYEYMIQDGALKSKILYSIKVRGFTEHGYRDTSTLNFQLPEDYDASAMIFGIIFGIIGTAILLGSIFILWRKRKRWAMKKESIKSIPLNPIPISIKSFPQYYNELSTDSDKLKHEYTLLATKSSEMTISTSNGLLPQNKKKNRYTNVIAYDHSRVKLKNSEDSTTDYINASYIKGYSDNVEYIATQGPLEHTLVDFWNMVLQENSCLIVMVAQFVEQNKDKCFKYFPNNHENMELDNGIGIRCCTELDFKTYIVRTLLVQKDMEQSTITHLQFMEWPDFGCPNGTQMMLEFSRLMREYAYKTYTPIVLHCSAGIGRTGTIIALDILLQTINENKDIDIFNTVLNLRKDRKNMVQTEKQYLYIYNCICDAIETPAPVKNNIIHKEPIYENVEEIKKVQEELHIKESKF